METYFFWDLEEASFKVSMLVVGVQIMLRAGIHNQEEYPHAIRTRVCPILQIYPNRTFIMGDMMIYDWIFGASYFLDDSK